MFEQEKYNYFYNSIKLDFLKGNYNDSPKIPTDFEILKKLSKYIIPGLYFDFPKIKFNNTRTDVTEYNNNLQNIKYDFMTLFNVINNNITEIDDQFQNSLAERNKVIRELNIIDKEIDIMDSNPVDPAAVEYYFTDSFNNSKFIDFKRSKNLFFNPDDGTVKIDIKNANRIDFSHYLNKRGNYFVITSNSENIISQNNLPNTKFDAMFTEDQSDKWVYEIKTSEEIEITGYFILNLNTTANKELINRIVIRFANLNDANIDANSIWIEYKKENEWIVIPETIDIINTMDMEFNFSAIETQQLKFNFRKTTPDNIDKLLYYIGIQELNVFHSENKFNATLITKPIEITPYSNENLSIFSAMLETSELLGENTNINYYVGIDEQISGKIMNENNEIVNIYSPDASSFIANDYTNYINGEPENFFVYASDLREHYYISGAINYENWQPEWIPIKPKNSINSSPELIFFNTTTEYNNLHNLCVNSGITGSGNTGWFRNKCVTNSGTLPYATYTEMIPAIPDFQANGKEFYKIFYWNKTDNPIIDSIKLYTNPQNVDSSKWTWNYNEKDIVRKIILENKTIGADNLYIINDSGINAKIQMDSITDIHLITQSQEKNIDCDIHYYYDHRSLSGLYPYYNRATIDFNRYFADYSNTVYAAASITQNNTDIAQLISRNFHVSYNVEQTEKSISTWNTYIKVPSNIIDPYILIGTEIDIITNESIIEKVEITNIDNNSKILLNISDLNKNTYLNPGTYLIRIFTDAYIDSTKLNYGNPKWNPINKNHFFMSDGIEQYSSLKSISLIDFFTLLYDVNIDDDSKCSVIKDIDNTTYLIVQKPSLYKFPGYNNKGLFQTNYGYNNSDIVGISGAILNNLHYTRSLYNNETNTYTYWTTGSSGNFLYPSGGPSVGHKIYKKMDSTYPNTIQDKWYYNISTYDEYINIHDKYSSGYLFFESAENLESYYQLSYRLPNRNKTQRIFLKAEFRSNDKNKVPVLDKYKLILNHTEFNQI